MAVEIKTVGTNGQISIGKKHAGRTVMLEEVEKGVWSVRLAQVIPDNELWMHREPAKSIIDEALAWSDAHPEPRISDLSEFEARLFGRPPKAKKRRK